MTLSTVKTPSLRWIAENLRLLLQQPPRRQIAALCYRQGKKGPEVLLITSRKTKRWIIPKGWPMAEYSDRRAASIEAFEEAGVIGKADRKPLGEIVSHKGMGNGLKVRTMLTVYALKVGKQIGNFPEKGKRDLAWLPIEKAAERCSEPAMRDFLVSEEVRALLMQNGPSDDERAVASKKAA